MALPKIGNLAPSFILLNQNEQKVSLKDFKGKNIVLYFYPKAMTPGCTTQACGVRDFKNEFEKIDAIILAVSPDAPARLLKFAEKYDLNFNLLSDPDHLTATNYGVWGKKKMMGREYMGILRTTFIIDKKGKLHLVLDKVNTKTHHEDILTILKDMA